MKYRALLVSQDLCNGCRSCEDACSYGAISIFNGKARINFEKCVLCMVCLESCQQDAISVNRIRREVDLKAYRGVWVFIECRNRINQGCLQILSKGFELAKKLDQPLHAVVVGRNFDEMDELTNELKEYRADVILFLRCKDLRNYQAEDVAEILARQIMQSKPAIVLFLGSSFGRVLAPRVAAKVETGLTADCTDLYIDHDGNLVQVRPTYGGKILASIVCSSGRPQMASVRPNVFESVKRGSANGRADVFLRDVEVDSIEGKKRVVETFKDKNRKSDIAEAQIIVCGGFGVGSKEGFDLLGKLAERIGGVVAGSRSAVDQGWIDFSHQIGQTGKIVRPRVYIACGVSGAIHHLIGMKNSQFIIAINKDVRAPIFKIADIGVVADLYDVVPKLIESL